jgi:hypothetical protein
MEFQKTIAKKLQIEKEVSAMTDSINMREPSREPSREPPRLPTRRSLLVPRFPRPIMIRRQLFP